MAPSSIDNSFRTASLFTETTISGLRQRPNPKQLNHSIRRSSCLLVSPRTVRPCVCSRSKTAAAAACPAPSILISATFTPAAKPNEPPGNASAATSPPLFPETTSPLPASLSRLPALSRPPLRASSNPNKPRSSPASAALSCKLSLTHAANTLRLSAPTLGANPSAPASTGPSNLLQRRHPPQVPLCRIPLRRIQLRRLQLRNVHPRVQLRPNANRNRPLQRSSIRQPPGKHSMLRTPSRNLNRQPHRALRHHYQTTHPLSPTKFCRA